jgi:hypothetical protein
MFGDSVEVANDQRTITKLASNEIVAYLVGDFISPTLYEVVTAWVDKRYQGMDLGVKVSSQITNSKNIDVREGNG